MENQVIDQVENIPAQEEENIQIKQEVPVLTQEEQERINAYKQELSFKNELKHYSAVILSGIKANSTRSNNKDMDQIKEAVRLSLSLMNYVNSLPLNFQGQG